MHKLDIPHKEDLIRAARHWATEAISNHMAVGGYNSVATRRAIENRDYFVNELDKMGVKVRFQREGLMPDFDKPILEEV